MRKADRLFQLVNLIRIHQPISAERLASRIGVSVRSIYRYIDDLSFSGIPIYGTTGVGYALDADFEMPPLTLNRLELDALMLGMEMLSASADNDLSAAARMLLSKISASLVHHKVDPSTAKIRALGTTPSSTRGHLATLRDAIENTQALKITYTRLDGAVSQRLICPLVFSTGEESGQLEAGVAPERLTAIFGSIASPPSLLPNNHHPTILPLTSKRI